MGAAPGNSTPDSQKGAPGQIQEHKSARAKKPQVGRASWYGRIFQNKKVPDIVKQIFDEMGFKDYKLQLYGDFLEREAAFVISRAKTVLLP